MLLRAVPIYLNVLDYENPFGSQFLFEMDYLNAFLSRKVRPLKFKTAGFLQVCIQGCHEPGPCRIANRSAVVPLRFDRASYELLSIRERHDFRVKMAIDGVNKCRDAFDVPADQILAFVQEFVDGDYVNRWVHRRQRLQRGLWATLKCEIDPERFRLRLELSNKSGVFFEEEVLETLPDALIYKHRFAGVSMNGNKVEVVDKFGEAIYETTIQEVRGISK